MEIIICNNCGNEIVNEEVYCYKCYLEIVDEIGDITEENKNLKEYIKNLENELESIKEEK